MDKDKNQANKGNLNPNQPNKTGQPQSKGGQQDFDRDRGMGQQRPGGNVPGGGQTGGGNVPGGGQRR
jgi:hypothetical protein